MDGDRFDRLTRVCASRLPRRSALGIAAAFALGGALPMLERQDVKAKCGKKKPCPACKVCKKGKCKKIPDGSDCGSGRVCAGGVCQCSGDTKACGDGCIPNESCCDRNDCGKLEDCCHSACVDITTSSNCGTCSHSCMPGEDCCDGNCVDIASRNNCGACGNVCGADEDCCSGSCVNIATPLNCGSCGNACPGQTTTSDAICADPAAGRCDMTCRDGNYDVDGDPANGCEQLDAGGGHTRATATSLGTVACKGGGRFQGTIMSDRRVHANPPVDGFDAGAGAAPDWWTVTGTRSGGNCFGLLGATITTSGGSSSGKCYEFTVDTGLSGPRSILISGNDSTSINGIPYGFTVPIFFKFEKTCDTAVQEAMSYSVGYLLT